VPEQQPGGLQLHGALGLAGVVPERLDGAHTSGDGPPKNARQTSAAARRRRAPRDADCAAQRTRVIASKLRSVDALPGEEATALLGLPMPDGEQQQAELGPGDVLLSLAPEALEPAILMAARALGVATPRLEEAGLTGAASIATLLGRYAPAYQHVTESESIIRSNGIV
jgi:hypothetical protein